VKRLAPLAALGVWLAPAVALACPVCFDQDAPAREAYLATTVFLSLVPLALIGGLAFALHRRARARADEKRDESEGSLPEPAPGRG